MSNINQKRPFDFLRQLKIRPKHLLQKRKKQRSLNQSQRLAQLEILNSSQTPLASKWINFEILNTVVAQAVTLRIAQIVAQDEEFLSLGEQKLQLEKEELKLNEQKRAATKKFHSDMAVFLNLYVVVVALMLGSVAIGVFIGLNTPEIVACRSEHTPCWHLRLRHKITN